MGSGRAPSYPRLLLHEQHIMSFNRSSCSPVLSVFYKRTRMRAITTQRHCSQWQFFSPLTGQHVVYVAVGENLWEKANENLPGGP